MRELVTTHSPSKKILYNALARAEHFGVMPPITRSFWISSTITWPGNTRSGQYAILISAG
ncbi:hypothetical protein YPPY102_4372, partial [Yersinia pestis PY-102]